MCHAVGPGLRQLRDAGRGTSRLAIALLLSGRKQPRAMCAADGSVVAGAIADAVTADPVKARPSF
jgi:hypothetical protein